MTADRRALTLRLGLMATALVLATVLTLALHALAASACTITWTGGGTSLPNSWSEPNNWEPNRVPGAADEVCIPVPAEVEINEDVGSIKTLQSEGTLVLSQGAKLLLTGMTRSSTAGLIQQGGELGGKGSLLVGKSFEWVEGEQIEAGTTEIAAEATLSIRGADYLSRERTLRIDAGANATIGSSGRIYAGENTKITNEGTLTAEGSEEAGTGIYAQQAGAVLRNKGLFTYTGSGSLTVNVAFDNEKTAEATAGVLSLEGGGTESAASVFDGNGGVVHFSSGTFAFTAGAALDGRVAQISGRIRGSLSVKGSFEWVGGEQLETGTTQVTPEATLSIKSGTAYLEKEHVLQVDAGAMVTMGAAGRLYVGEDATIANAGAFNAEGDEESGGGIYAQQAGGVLRNTGVFTRAGAGSFPVTVAFDNEGTARAITGVLSLGAGGTESAASVFNGINGVVHFSEGAFAFTAGAALDGRVAQVGGRIRGSLSVNGSFEWAGGEQLEAGTTEIAANATLSIKSGIAYLEKEHVLQVDAHASVTMGASGRLYVGEDVTIANAGAFNAEGDEESGGGIYAQQAGGVLRNTGVFTRAGNGSFPVSIEFDNKGEVLASSGTLSLEKGGLESATATFSGERLAEGPEGVVGFAGGSFTFTAGATLSGHTAQTGGSLRGPLVVKDRFEWLAGVQEEAGATEVAPGGLLTITGGDGYLEKGHVLQVDAGGTVTMGASGRLYVGEAVISNAGTFNAEGDEENGGGIFAQTGGGVLHNTGLFTRSGNGSFATGITFDNEGTVDVALGTLAAATFNQGANGILGVHFGGLLPSVGARLSVEGTASIGGKLRVTTENAHPEPGQRFQVLTGGSLRGTFASIEEIGVIGGGWSYAPVYETDGVELVVGGGPVPTSTTATIAGGGQTGGTIAVPEGTVVTSEAVLSGTDASTATGSISYRVYSDAQCSNEVANAGTLPVKEGSVASSSPEVFPAGTYYWQVSYSGDSTSQRSASTCGADVENVQQTPTAGTGAAAPQGAVAAAKEEQLPAPVSGHSASLLPVSGTVSVRLPGHKGFQPLASASDVPVGTVVNATQGHVTLCRATQTHSAKQCAEFNGGQFRIEEKTGAMTAHVALEGGSFTGCPASRPGAARAAGTRAAAAKSQPMRALWGSGHGHFTTDARNSSTTVRGTIWYVEDRCTYTLTEVKRGVVKVYDYRLHRTVEVSAGHSYIARAR
jgi:hypothetical protein